MKQDYLRKNSLPDIPDNGDAESPIRIGDSCAALAERQELCELRSASFDPEKTDPAWAGFLWACLEKLKALRDRINENRKLCKLENDPETNQTNSENINLCKPEKTEESGIPYESGAVQQAEIPCGPAAPQKKYRELCRLQNSRRLQNFWLTELDLLPPGALVPAWETTLQILLEAEYARAENVPVNEQEVRNILYSYFYDYADRLVTDTAQESFLAAFSAGKDTPHVREGLSLFFGDRLKARLLDILEKKRAAGILPSARKDGESAEPVGRWDAGPDVSPGHEAAGGNKPSEQNSKENAASPVPDLTPHQQKTLAEFRKKAAVILTTTLLVFSLAACGGTSVEEKNTESQTAEEDGSAYPGTAAYQDREQEIDDRFGIMHATVLDVQNGEKDGLFIYTLRDREDPENAWCLNSQDVGSIVCTVTGGKEVAVLFSGDIVNDPDNLEFIAILDDASLTIKVTEGTTVSNMLNSFTVRTDKGVEMNFIKDNCKVDKDALSTDPGSRILIYYTEGGSADHYPLRVYKLPQKEQ